LDEESNKRVLPGDIEFFLWYYPRLDLLISKRKLHIKKFFFFGLIKKFTFSNPYDGRERNYEHINNANGIQLTGQKSHG